MRRGPTRGAREPAQSWERSRSRALLVRLLAYGLPFFGGWMAVRTLGPSLFRPEGWVGIGIWVVQAFAVASAAAFAIERISRGLFPLAFLLDQSLVFPDRAPGRFSIALRANTLRRLHDRVGSRIELPADGRMNDAATEAIALIAALSRHDALTRGHTERVRAYSDLIAAELGLPDSDRERLAWGVMLHDVGKLHVPAEILNKKTPLTLDEWDIMQGHAALGRDIIAPLLPWLGDWGLAVAEHHERWDGDGYPAGLVGAEISIAGRITQVADAYDVIVSKRSYKEALSAEAARDELVRCAGSQFDPDVVRALLNVSLGRRWRAGPFAWLAEIPSVLRTATAVPGAIASSGAAAIGAVALSSAPTGTLPDEIPFAQPSTTVQTTTTVDIAPVGFPTTVKVTSSTQVGTATPLSPQASATVTTVPTTAATASQVSASHVSASQTTAAPTSATAVSTTTLATTTVAPTTTAVPDITTTTAPIPVKLVVFLTNPGSGDSNSHRSLPLLGAHSPSLLLPNYDTERNSEPGLAIQKDGEAITTSDRTKHQRWHYDIGEISALAGPSRLTVWVGAKDLNQGESIGIVGALEVCTPGCQTVATASWNGTSTAGYSMATLNFPAIAVTLPADSKVAFRIAAPDSLNSTDLQIAYDAIGYESQLEIG